MSNPLKIACYGEILWDIFPDKERLGGAPLNVALRLHSFGADVAMISTIGKDGLGKKAKEELTALGLDTQYIQEHTLPTGTVNVSLDQKGSPSYKITEQVAWDDIKTTPENITAVKTADALVIGSLALRQDKNLLAIENLIENAQYTVFDLNLRAPYYDIETVVALMEAADLIKLNDEELELIVIALGIEGETLEEELKMLSAMTETPTVCVTLGSEGAMLYHKGGIHSQVGFPCKVLDTVGAGDSFLATLIFGILSGETPDDALEVACAVGSLVAGKAGANAVVSQEEINYLLESS